MFEVSVLASGSSGNCFYIGSEKGDILIDAGITCKQISYRLDKIGKSIAMIKGVFITHEHIDHIRSIEMLSKKYGIPIYINKATLANSVFQPKNFTLFNPNQDIDLDGLKILPFSKSHDAADPVSFLIKGKSRRVSVITDIGYCCDHVKQAIKESDLSILESNHDLNMLRTGSYPEYLKKRISGKRGHLSNYEAALAVLEHGSRRLQHVLLSHLSLNNNTPKLALQTFGSILQERVDLKHLRTWLTYRDRPTDIIHLD